MSLLVFYKSDNVTVQLPTKALTLTLKAPTINDGAASGTGYGHRRRKIKRTTVPHPADIRLPCLRLELLGRPITSKVTKNHWILPKKSSHQIRTFAPRLIVEYDEVANAATIEEEILTLFAMAQNERD